MNNDASFKFQRAARLLLCAGLVAVGAAAAHAQTPDLSQIPEYKPEYKVSGGLRIAGSELKGNVDLLVEGFRKFHPDAVVSTNFMT